MPDPKVTRIPTAATTYYRVRKFGKAWAVEVVTPCPGFRDLRTVVAKFASREAAITEAEKIGAKRHRPVHAAGGAS